MKNFEDLLNAVNTSLNSMVSSESTTEQIEKVNSIKTQLEELQKSHNNLVEEHSKIKDLYIESVKNYGTAVAGSNEIGQKQPRTLEQIAQEILNKEKK